MIRSQLSILPSNTDALIEFPRWIAQHCDRTSIVLDVGAGRGITASAAIIRQKVALLVGVDPDASIAQNPYLDERYHASSKILQKTEALVLIVFTRCLYWNMSPSRKSSYPHVDLC